MAPHVGPRGAPPRLGETDIQRPISYEGAAAADQAPRATNAAARETGPYTPQAAAVAAPCLTAAAAAAAAARSVCYVPLHVALQEEEVEMMEASDTQDDMDM